MWLTKASTKMMTILSTTAKNDLNVVEIKGLNDKKID